MAKAKKKAKKPLKKRPAKKSARAAKKPARPAKKATRKPAKKPAKKPARAAAPEFVSTLPPPVKVIVSLVRKLVHETAPEAVELVQGNTAAWKANGLFARLEASEQEVILSFLQGARLDAPAGLLQPGEGEERTIALHRLEDVREQVLAPLVRQAVLLNLGHHEQPPPPPPEALLEAVPDPNATPTS